MSLEKQWRMVRRLLEKTATGDLDWKPSPTENTYQLSFQRYTLLLRQAPSDRSPGEDDYWVTLLNEQGDVADTFSDVEIADEFAASIVDPDKTPYRTMGRLFDQARRHALGTDRILDTILDDLDGPPNPF